MFVMKESAANCNADLSLLCSCLVFILMLRQVVLNFIFAFQSCSILLQFRYL
jgi:hypothetical protein